MKSIKEQTRLLNTFKKVCKSEFTKEELDICFRFCKIPKSAFYQLVKYDVVIRIAKDKFVLYPGIIYYGRLKNALDEYHARQTTYNRTFWTKKRSESA